LGNNPDINPRKYFPKKEDNLLELHEYLKENEN